METEVALRTMTVAMATTPSGSPQGWGSPGGRLMQMSQQHEVVTSVDQQPRFEGVQNAAQASWSVASTRRSVPVWVQRLGAFFQEMRPQGQSPAMWAPSPMGSPPQQAPRRALGPGNAEGGHGGGQGPAPLLSPQHQEQLRRMERNAPLLYGPRQERGQESSGGSTYEAVQEEVKKQLRGVVEQLEASRQEAHGLRQEVLRLRNSREHGNDQDSYEYPQGPPRAFGGYLSGDVVENQGVRPMAKAALPPLPLRARTSTTEASGLQTAGTTTEASGVQATLPSTAVSGLQAPLPTTAASGLYAAQPTTGTSGLDAGLTVPTVTAVQGAGGQPGLGTQDVPMGTGDDGSRGDPMTRLLEGLEKVIKGNKPEELSKSVEAPKLPEISESSSVDFGDWLYCLEHSMGDLSASSAEWWRMVVKDAQDYYDKYQQADQFARLALKPEQCTGLQDPKWTRVDRRGASLLIAATPDDVKKEIIASRAKTTLEVLSRLMVLYRPGSAVEKGQLLKKIENPEPASTPQEAVESLRQWLRYYQRARDLRLGTPDPSILVRALDSMLKKPITDNQEITFRMNLLRYHLKVDFAPTEDNVLAVHRAFLAEFEQLGFRKPKVVKAQDPPANPKVRAVEAPQGSTPMPTTTPKGGLRPCRFYLSDEGCRRGKACKYEHSMKELSKAERRDRCYECGAKGHLSSACPTRKESAQQKAMATGDSPQSSTGGTNGRRNAGGPSRSPKGAEKDAIAQTGTGVEPAQATVQAESPVQGVPVEQLLEDAQKLMKAFMEQKSTPNIKVLRVETTQEADVRASPALRELMKSEEDMVNMCRMGLLDSGATHALRPRTPQDKGEKTSVSVTLAGEQKVQMDQTKSGTILGDKQTQPIVPLGTLVQALGYEFAWDRKGCRLRHPDRKEIKVYTRSNCPEIAQCDALRLIAELEEAKLSEAMGSLATLRSAIMAARDYTQWGWKEAIREYVSTREKETGVKAVLAAPFMHHVPMEDQLKVVVEMPKTSEEAWTWMKSFPLNRAKRRQLWQAPDWTVHLFAGKGVKNDPLRDLPGFLEIDLQKGWNLNDGKIYGVLLWAATQGRVKQVIGGPPGGTFAPFRYQSGRDGPRPVRSNHEPWGLREGLGVEESTKVKNENAMILKMIWLWTFAEAALDDPDVPGHKVGFCMEFPEDPRSYLPEGDQKQSCVSVWRTEFMREFINVTQFSQVKFEQGALGHQNRRPTCCLTNLELGIQGLKDSRAFLSNEEADPDQSVWPFGFRITLADAIHEWIVARSAIAVKKAMTKSELAEWKAHIERGHIRDCSVCLSASGTGRPARRVVHRDAYVLSLDIAGPFADVGRDEVRGCRYKFALAATYLYPKVRDVPEDSPIPDEEEAEKFLAEEEDQPEDGEQGPEDPSADAQEEEWKRKVEDLKKPMEMQALRFVIPLERHSGKEVLEAVQDLHIRIRALGLPVVRIHSDRAREFRVKPLRKWCRERDIYQTYTEGLAPAQNATAESHVKWLKSKARLHLQDAELDKELWPCAMKHACKLHNARELGEKAPEIRFGAVVWVKSKKDRGPFDPKWERGVYMGPADDVREGHVVRLDDGLWLRTLHMRTVRDDEVEDDEEEEFVVDLVEPTRRLRMKTKLTDPEVRAMDAKCRKTLVDKLLASPIWSSPEAKIERPQMKNGEAWEDAAYVNLGAYQHGGITSITVATEKFSHEAELATSLLKKDHPGKVFTSVALVKNATMPLHRDAFNMKSTVNLVSPLKVSKGSSVWQEMKPGDEFYGKYKAMWFREKEIPGQLFSVEKPTTVRPDRLHAPLRGEDGDRIVIIGYTVSKWEKLYDHQCEDLMELGFQLPEREPQLRMRGIYNDATNGDYGGVGLQFLGTRIFQRINAAEASYGRRYGGEFRDSTNGSDLELIGKLRKASRRFPRVEWGEDGHNGHSWRKDRAETSLHDGSQENVVMTSTPLMPLGHDEEEHLRRRVSWLSDLVEEERQARRAREARGEYAGQRERQMFYKLDEAIDYMNELLAVSDHTRQQNRVNLMRMAVGHNTSENVEEMLRALDKPLETVHTVDLQEVKRHLQEWTPSIAKEVQTLEGSGTLRPMPLQEAREKAAKGELVLVPAKTVHTAKPPGEGDGLFKRRSRIVICGNYINNEVEVYTASANAESVRCSLSYGARKRWHGAVTDVNSAFTLTPMTESKVRYAITMPKVVVDAGCAPAQTAYLVDRVLYGLREAPRLWGSFRDRRISRAKLKMGDKQCVFLQMETDPAVWRLVEVGNESETLALMIVYVDDAMMLITEGTEGDEGWKCSPLEWLGKEPVRYLGMDVRRREKREAISFHISQGSYVTELLRNYPEEAARPSQIPASKEVMPMGEEGEAEAGPVDEDLVRQAQKMAGELLWLLTRTRPDVGFATAHVCSAATKDPASAIKLAKMTMRYLASTVSWGLCYDGQGGPVVAYSDASFAPQGDRSFGCVTTATYGGFAAWRMTKQPTIALSAAEAELVELLNASQQAAGLQAWVNEVSSKDADEPMELRVDNTAACGLATTAPGSWKTRHLKVKARHLRMETNEGRIVVTHTPGEVQVADMGTKPVPVSRLQDLRKLWRMCSAEDFEKDDGEVIIRSLQGPEYYDLLRMFVWLMMVSRVPTAETAEVNSKKPLDYDGSFEFYGLLLIAGVALLGMWETLKWVAHKFFGDDEATIAKARRLLRIRNQATKALQEELASMTSASSSDPMFEGKPNLVKEAPGMMPQEPLGITTAGSIAPTTAGSTTPATARSATPATSSAAATTRAVDDPDLRAALESAQNGQYRRLRRSFVMSEHGDRLHTVADCHGLRHANKTRLKQMQVCYYCDGNFPLYYKVTHGQVLPEG
ncbi:GIP [Symbiodinium sp. CCMP2592]|nr:GIP [Symbiodinium sp. CCMP2592]